MTDTLTPKKLGLQTDMFNEDKQLSRRGLPKYKHNPFVNDTLITQLSGLKNVYYTQNTATAICDIKTGEIEPAKLQVVKQIRADKQTFVKLYTTHLKAYFELSQTAFRLLQFVLHTTQETAINKDKIYLSLLQAQEFFEGNNSKISRTSYFNAMKELVEKLFLAETQEPNFYFINPTLFFNGDRIEFLTQFTIDKQQEPLDKKLTVVEATREPKSLLDQHTGGDSI